MLDSLTRLVSCTAVVAAVLASEHVRDGFARDMRLLSALGDDRGVRVISLPARSGAIEGVVTVPARPPRRVANRYPAGAAGAHALQEVPVIAYIEGVVPGAPAARATEGVEIAQRDTAFTPSLIVVPVNTTVTFPNGDPFFHNVFSYSPTQRFDLGRYPRGESKTVVFDKPGTVKLYCEVHDYMRAAVIVVQNPYHAVVGADGRFTISGVPAGRHKLVIWHTERNEPLELDVNVAEGGVARVQATLD